MKKLYRFLSFPLILLSSMLLLPGALAAGSVETLIGRLPAPTQAEFDSTISAIAATGHEGMLQLADMLQPASEGQNATVEYALNGLAAYLSAPGRESQCAVLRQALKDGVDRCGDNANRAFLLTLLQRCGTAEDAPFFAKYVGDPYLQQWALNGLIALPDADEALLKVLNSGAAPRAELAYAAGLKGLSKAEPMILNWIAEAAAGDDRRPYYKALGAIGSAKALPLLEKAAKTENYAWEPYGATEAYIGLIHRLYDNGGRKQALSAAKKLLKATDRSNVRCDALALLMGAPGAKVQPLLIEALADADREYRVNALRVAEPMADEAMLDALGKLLMSPSVATEAKTDVVSWLGAVHASGQIEPVVAMFGMADAELAAAAIRTAGRIGGETALTALVAQLGKAHSDEASAALLAFNGKVNGGVASALYGDAQTQLAALRIAGQRHVSEAYPQVSALLSSADAVVRAAAYEALPGVVDAGNFTDLVKLVESGSVPAGVSLSDALLSSVRSLSPERQYAMVEAVLPVSSYPQTYYPVLARAATPEAVSKLLDGYASDKPEVSAAALSALLDVDRPEMIDLLYGIAVNDGRHEVLHRYAVLVGNSGYDASRKFALYSNGLEATADAGVRNALLNGLGSVNTFDALLLAHRYQADDATARAAAAAVRGIASKTLSNPLPEQVEAASVRSALERAREIYTAGGSADDGYAVDDINGMLAKLP